MTQAAVWMGILLAALGHGFFWMGLVNRLHGLDVPRRRVKRITEACLVVFVAIPIAVAWNSWTGSLGSFNPFGGSEWTAWYARAAAAMGVVGVARKRWIMSTRYDPSALVDWRVEVRDVARSLGRRPVSGALARAYCALPGNEALCLSVDRKRLAIPRLPAGLSGLTIAHLSDLHMRGGVGREFFDAAVFTTNNLRPDVIAVTGDIVENEACWPWIPETLGKLCAPLGVFYILGNHDVLIDPARTRELLDEAGLVDVGGRWLRAEWNGEQALVGGNEVPWFRPAPLEDLSLRVADAGHGAAPDEFRLALCHSPDQFRWCERAGVDLALAGHTHGGQVQLPLLGPIASPSLYGTRYASGVFRRGATVLHVTRGLSSEKPIRWRSPPEIALLELTRGS